MASEIKLPCLPTRPRRAVRSLWLEQALADERAESAANGSNGVCRHLGGVLAADVCVVGGGFAGLWTALHLKADDPSLDVVVIEGDICGGGASGRNGGFVMSWWSKFSTLKKLCGLEEARRLARVSADAVGAIGRFCDDHGIDADYHHDGWLWTATSAAQVGAWEATLAAVADSGESPFEPLTSTEVARRSCSPTHLAGVFEPTCATVHPGRLCRGLAREAAKQGVRVFEKSPVTGIVLASRPVVRTASGEVSADRVVLTINAWAAQLEAFKRSLVVVASDVIATAPIPDRLSAMGWRSGIAISDSRRLVNYYRRTDDGRIVFGKGGGTLGYRGRVGRSFQRASPRVGNVGAHFHRLYPMLWDVPADRAWRGPIDYSVTGMPAFIRIAGRPDVIAAAGFSGNGVGPTYVAGRILASMAAGRDDEWASTGLAAQPSRGLPPEPVRYVGGLAVRAAIDRKEACEDAYQRPGRLTTFLAGQDPTSFVDRGPGRGPEDSPGPVGRQTDGLVEPGPDVMTSLSKGEAHGGT